MNKNIVLASIASLVIGYFLYPVLNKNQLEKPSSKVVDSTHVPEKQTPTAKNAALSVQNKNKVGTLESESDASSEIDTNDSHVQEQTDVIEQNDFVAHESNIVSTEQLIELQTWSEAHKISIKELLNNNLAEEQAEKLMNQITRENPFLSDPTVHQDANSDEQWSYKMTEIINHQIAQHPNGVDLEILSLTCKQLTCELLVREIVRGSWFRVYPALIEYFLSNQYLIKTEGIKQLLFQNGDEFLFYQHLVFSK